MANRHPSADDLAASRSAYRGLIVAAPFAMAAWLIMLGGVFLLR